MKHLIAQLFMLSGSLVNGQTLSVRSPDNNIVMNLSTVEKLSYTKKYDKEPEELKKSNSAINSPGTLKVTMAKNGGFVAVINR